MPIYNYRCSNDHTVEKILPIEERSNPGPCPECGGELCRIYLSRLEWAQRFDPVMIDVGPNGEHSYPMHKDAPVPEGFMRRELRTFAEIDSALKGINRDERRLIEQKIERDHEAIHDSEARNHGELRQLMQSMSPQGRAFARYAMQRAEQRRPRTFDPNVFLPVREFDSTNRDAYEDRRTGWNNRKG